MPYFQCFYVHVLIKTLKKIKKKLLFLLIKSFLFTISLNSIKRTYICSNYMLKMNFNGLYTQGNKILVSRYQTSGEIAGAIVKAINDSKESAEKLSPYFKGSNKKDTCKTIFVFLKKVVPYKKESSDNQTAKTINRILKDANKDGGDCKHYATFSASLCKALNIPCKLRLISQRFNDTTPNHIYCVAIVNGKEVIIDPVLNTFDTEARYNYKYDINI